MTQSTVPGPVEQLTRAGVSIWLDDLSRERLRSGNLADLVATRGVVGVTTNPTIFAAALSTGDAYDAQLAELAAAGTDDAAVEAAVERITTDDVRAAADLLRPVYDATDGVDGRVSIEVDPRLAHDADKTVTTAERLWRTIDRPNVFIKIPATVAGLDAISRTLAQGISVNVTLIFSLARYRAVMEAFAIGLEQARADGIDLAPVGSVPPSSSPASTPPWTPRSRRSARPRRSTCAGRPRSRTRGSRSRRTRSSARRTAGARSRRPARTRSARCGPRRA